MLGYFLQKGLQFSIQQNLDFLSELYDLFFQIGDSFQSWNPAFDLSVFYLSLSNCILSV